MNYPKLLSYNCFERTFGQVRRNSNRHKKGIDMKNDLFGDLTRFTSSDELTASSLSEAPASSDPISTIGLSIAGFTAGATTVKIVC